MFTPLKIYNGTPEGVPLEIQGQQLPINELNGTPLKGACPISNLHRCKGTMVFSQIERYKVVSKKKSVSTATFNNNMIGKIQNIKPCGKCGNSK